LIADFELMIADFWECGLTIEIADFWDCGFRIDDCGFVGLRIDD